MSCINRKHSDDLIDLAIRMRVEGHSFAEIIRATGIPQSTLRFHFRCYDGDGKEITPAEIARRAAKIRADWSPRERAKRAGIVPGTDGWTLPRARVLMPEAVLP